MNDLARELRVRLLNFWTGLVFFAVTLALGWASGISTELPPIAAMSAGSAGFFVGLYLHGVLSFTTLVISLRREAKSLQRVLPAGFLSLSPPIVGYWAFTATAAAFPAVWRIVYGLIAAGLLYVGFSIMVVSLVAKGRL